MPEPRPFAARAVQGRCPVCAVPDGVPCTDVPGMRVRHADHYLTGPRPHLLRFDATRAGDPAASTVPTPPIVRVTLTGTLDDSWGASEAWETGGAEAVLDLVREDLPALLEGMTWTVTVER